MTWACNQGTPLHPTLGSPTRSLDEIYERLGDSKFSAEFKYDGQRVQIHASQPLGSSEEPNVRLFSRHLEDMTQKVCTTHVSPRLARVKGSNAVVPRHCSHV